MFSLYGYNSDDYFVMVKCGRAQLLSNSMYAHCNMYTIGML